MTGLIEVGARVDARLGRAGLDLTTGGEPTFTVASTTAPEWRSEPLGDDKRARARSLARALGRILRAEVEEVPGRKYAGEDEPRWCLRIARGTLVGNVTPDPGVVEVNLPPARTFRELSRFVTATYRAAEEAGLAAIRVLHNGRVVGSGGGAHVTLGGPTLARSPFVRRPALLAELVAYVHNHPSLSYALVGMSAGATSQAPRVDESGADRLRDLRIAVGSIRARSREVTVGEVHASLAPLHCDVTGNTHRAEINLEKLVPLGLVELRAVEAQPTSDCWLAAALVWRALVARLATKRYGTPLADHGERLHDECASPSWMRADLAAVLSDLGLPAGLLDDAIDRRYPVLGVLEAPGVRAEVRPALEFWPVVGPLASQESAASRFVDSTVERIEIALSGPRASRVVAGVNGRPIAQIRVRASRVGAVRYRAAPPVPGGLQPLVPVHAPLEISLVDRASGRPLARARLHAWHPGGGGYASLPKDLAEAASRRRARFETVAPGSRKVRLADPHGVWTLDLLAG